MWENCERWRGILRCTRWYAGAVLEAPACSYSCELFRTRLFRARLHRPKAPWFFRGRTPGFRSNQLLLMVERLGFWNRYLFILTSNIFSSISLLVIRFVWGNYFFKKNVIAEEDERRLIGGRSVVYLVWPVCAAAASHVILLIYSRQVSLRGWKKQVLYLVIFFSHLNREND